MSAPILPGCEPFSFDGGRTGVLVLHGFTGNPRSMRGIADRMADAGMSVEMPLLPGHGTVLDDMIPMRFVDWTSAAEHAYETLAARTDHVVVLGLSMGGTLTCWLAETHPEIAAIVLVNPLVEPVAAEMVEGLTALRESGIETFDAIGSDIAKEGVVEMSYPGTPVAAAFSLFEGVEGVAKNLPAISCPVLLFSSEVDHVVSPSNGPFLVERVSGPIERVLLERSFHVATMDHDAEFIEVEAVAFVERIASQRTS